MPTPILPSIHIYFLDRPKVVPGERILRATDWLCCKTFTLPRQLAPEHRLFKDQLINFLWPNAPPINANNLYCTV